MTAVDKLRNITQVYYHQSCPDGTVSALIVYAALKLLLKEKVLDIDFKTVQYNTKFFEEKLEPRPGQLFVDITPPRTRWEMWKDFDPIVLDHHESVEHIVRGLNGVYATNEAHSGARLAFEQVLVPIVEHLTADLDPERDSHNVIRSDCNIELERWDEISRIAMIRDTWKGDHEDFVKATVQTYGLMTIGAREMMSAIREDRLDFGLVTKLGEMDYGKAKFAVEQTRRYSVPCPYVGKDLVVDVYNCTEKKFISDGCHILLKKDTDLAISYFYKTDDGKTTAVVSLRSNYPICSTIAARLGGGGHDKAAGFGIPDGETVSMNGIVEVVRNQLLGLVVEEAHSQ